MNEFKSFGRFFCSLFFFITFISFAAGQETRNESIVFTTYFPSPTHHVNTFVVKEKIAIGDQSGSEIENLTSGQIYVGHSIILGDTPLPASNVPGEIIYNSNFDKLQFYNGTEWINASN